MKEMTHTENELLSTKPCAHESALSAEAEEKAIAEAEETEIVEAEEKAMGGSKSLSWKIAIPVAIGLAVVVWLFMRDARSGDIVGTLSSLSFGATSFWWFLAALLFIGVRETGYAWRYRVLTDRHMSWGGSYRVTFLCEFMSCITPSAVGGSSMAMFFMHSEGIESGRATSLMLTTLFLDELFFVVFCPVVVLFTPAALLFDASASGGFAAGLQMTFWIIYALITLWTLVLFLGIMVKPVYISRALGRLFSLPGLRRWHGKIVSLGDNMTATGKELRTKPFRFWARAFGATAITWTARFLVVNILFLIFLPESWSNQWIILARQYVVWVVLMVTPTPGGSGVSEWLFPEYYGSLIPSSGLALVMALCWRILTYYIYLIIGAFVVPRWLKRSFSRQRKSIAAT